MTNDELKAIVIADCGGLYAISPESYKQYLDHLCIISGRQPEEINKLVYDTLCELPCHMD